MQRQFIPLRIADKRAVQHQNLGLRTAFIQHVFQVSEARLQAHDPELTQAVDRRVGNLRKVLAEKMRQRSVGF